MKTLTRWAALPAALAALWTSDCQARLGETPVEIQARYGQPVYEDTFEGNRALHYKFGEFEVTVIFKAGKSVSESLLPIAEERRLGDDECRTLIEAISGTKDWKAPSHTKVFVTEWTCGDDFHASRTEDVLKTKMLIVATTELIRASKERRSRELADMASQFGDPVASSDSSKPAAVGTTMARQQARRDADMEEALFKFHEQHGIGANESVPSRPSDLPPSGEVRAREREPGKPVVTTVPQ